MMLRTATPRLLSLPLLAAAALFAACGTDSTEPRDETLSQLDDAIFQVMISRLSTIDETTEPTRTIEHALGTPVRELDAFPTGLAGQTLVYDGAWTVDESRDPVGDDVVRIIWYELIAQTPTGTERGHIDLTDQSATAPGRIGVDYVSADEGNVGSYTVRVRQTGVPPVETDEFVADGGLGGGSDRVTFHVEESVAENTDSGDTGYLVELAMSDAEFSYTGSLEEDRAAATQARTARCEGAITMAGATTSVEVTAEGVGETPSQGTGVVRHAGQTLAVLGDDGFERPDGSSFTAIEQDRLLGIVARLCLPLEAVPDHFR